MEAETGVMFLQAKNHQRLPENQQKLRDGQWAGDRVSLTALDGANQGELTPAPGWFSLTLRLGGGWRELRAPCSPGACLTVSNEDLPSF